MTWGKTKKGEGFALFCFTLQVFVRGGEGGGMGGWGGAGQGPRNARAYETKAEQPHNARQHKTTQGKTWQDKTWPSSSQKRRVERGLRVFGFRLRYFFTWYKGGEGRGKW